MITKQTTRTRRNDRLNEVAGQWRRMAIYIGLAAGMLLIVAVLLASCASEAPVDFRLSRSVRAQLTALFETFGLKDMIPNTHMQSPPLGIDLPTDIDPHKLPRGLTDYIRPSSVAPAAGSQAAPIHSAASSAYDGGAYRRARPAVRNPNMPVMGTNSAYDGRAYRRARPLNTGRPMQLSGTGSVYDGGSYVTVRPRPVGPIHGTGSAYDGGN